ncbi:RPII140-upstream gene protein [Harmonia axyridis]|uniref:RPII140-upstream gene protein n=1 Tax=Harmonia axyridis TaxID=115357 RepID=UPI001E275F91|nr:RPII140-upstream gene protein [Harmonia axyridis]
MIKYLNKYKSPGIMLGALFPLTSENDFDKVEVGVVEEQTSDGWQRLQKMFEIDEFGDMSNELTVVSQTAMVSGFAGLIYGGVMNSRTAYTDFMRHNTATSFSSHFEAKRKLQDAVTKSFGKGAWKWGWRVSLFTTSFVGISTMVSVYRGKSGIREYIVGGALTGTLYKWQMGPRGWIVGGLLGSVLGLFSGSISYGLLKMNGLTMSELRKYQADVGKVRKNLIKEGMRLKEEEDDALIKAHREKLVSENKI